MPEYDLLIAFFLAAGVFAYVPGPAMLYATAQTLARGRRAGAMAVLGLHLGGYVHVLAAAFGLAALFQMVPLLYLVVKIAGALYLIWLGVRMFFTPVVQGTDPQDIAPHSPRRAFWQSVTVEVLNPKTALFFLAFLPQFTDPNAGWPIWLQLLVLGSVVNLMFSSADVVCVVLGDRLGRALRRSARAGNMVRRVCGGVLVGLGLNLAVSRV